MLKRLRRSGDRAWRDVPPLHPHWPTSNVAGFFWLGPSGSRSITLISSSGAVRARLEFDRRTGACSSTRPPKFSAHMHIIVSRGTVDERNDGAARALRL